MEGVWLEDFEEYKWIRISPFFKNMSKYLFESHITFKWLNAVKINQSILFIYLF